MLTVNNVTKQYGNYKALDEVSLQVPQGSIYGLLGPNGAGKTTLIRIINAITAPDSGEVLLHGKRITQADVLKIGYLPEERGLYKKMKVGEQALFLAQLKGMTKANALKELKFWFEKFEIQAWWDKKIEELSKGMAQKVQFITTVLHRPELLILDEPFSGFDPVNAAMVKKEVLELKKQGTTIVLSTHNMASVEELCDNISLINKAKIVLQGNVAKIRATHTTNTFRLCTRATLAPSSDDVKITLTNKQNSFSEYRIQKPESMSNNQLLETLMQQGEIIAFEEILPSMNDIFIQTVN